MMEPEGEEEMGSSGRRPTVGSSGT